MPTQVSNYHIIQPHVLVGRVKFLHAPQAANILSKNCKNYQITYNTNQLQVSRELCVDVDRSALTK